MEGCPLKLDVLQHPRCLENLINAPINAISPELAARLTAPSAAYKNSVRLAVACLLLFVCLYCGMAGWFVYTAWQVFVDGAGSDLGRLFLLHGRLLAVHRRVDDQGDGLGSQLAP